MSAQEIRGESFEDLLCIIATDEGIDHSEHVHRVTLHGYPLQHQAHHLKRQHVGAAGLTCNEVCPEVLGLLMHMLLTLAGRRAFVPAPHLSPLPPDLSRARFKPTETCI